MEVSNLPKLLYIGDVPVESTVAGSALIYRLLQKYPVSQLCIVEGNTTISQLETRLDHVNYEVLNIGHKRLINSRFNSLYSSYLFLTARQRASQLTAIIKNFQPEAILTVAHGFSWLTAAELAKRYQLPLHLIVHDDLPSYIPVISQLKARVNQEFANVYRQAKSRFCVSPYMVECYQERYGVAGSVLYPCRAADFQEFDSPPQKEQSQDSSLTFAYAGSINSKQQAETLFSLASVLQNIKGKLIVYSALDRDFIEATKLDLPNIEIRSLIPYQKLIHTLRNEADILFAPMNFGLQQKSNMQLCFPSKLTDYTAMGLPILILGPEYCSAVKWAKENPGVAEVVIDNQSIEALKLAVFKLMTSPNYRYQLAKKALLEGYKYFSYQHVTEYFYSTLKNNNYTILSIV